MDENCNWKKHCLTLLSRTDNILQKMVVTLNSAFFYPISWPLRWYFVKSLTSFTKVGHWPRCREKKKILAFQALGPNQCKSRRQWKDVYALIQKKATTHQTKKADYISIPLYVTRICVYVPQIVNTDSLEDEIAMDFFSGLIFFPW